ncbi:hypothetical protein CHLRE_17g739600v5 [Chlamydomonas reinhardtii]|uniref:Uncharacterized protein n=1 Tax=Chlamydomonas reinhardtii TaxID=3055 RepID=A8IQZ8_CHLRE|nr:uncharacterized protein CHLRE_17g739600v5 [Chlamydomonas reinhardtii]PNW70937.1 hypothetical protein CHLRE_17g739600v5 [Chlamydomonas reinhardtii]|eukprot:XP_001691658.1 integral membrane protein [Chlamydomonas reinhardtii]
MQQEHKSAWTAVRGLTKVPRITVLFWIAKICCTTVGESLSDQVNETAGLGLGITAAVFFPILFAATFIQMKVRRYYGIIYWVNVILMSICGTIATDGLHDDAGLELWIEIIIFFVLMMTCFGMWYYYERQLTVHSIKTLRRETFYWLSILFTFAMGTAVGDGISEAWDIGYGPIFGFFAGVQSFIFLVWLALRLLGKAPQHSPTETLMFWVAYIWTRPVGASLGDLLSNDQSDGGAGLGTLGTSMLLLGVIIICVLIGMVTKYDIMPESDGIMAPAGSADSSAVVPAPLPSADAYVYDGTTRPAAAEGALAGDKKQAQQQQRV